MKIGVYAHWNVNWDGRTLTTLGCHARYVRHYLTFAERVRLFSSVSPTRREINSQIISDDRLEVVELPGGSFVSSWLKQRRLRGVFAENLDGLDAMYVRLFDPCPWLLAPLCETRGIGLVFHIVGNPIEGIHQRRDWSVAGRWARRLMFLPEETLVFRAARRHTLLINGGDLTRVFGSRHPNPETVISSTVEEAECYEREDTCIGKEVTILYTGFIRPAKHLETLIDAVAMLIQEGRCVRLRLVGAGDPPSCVDSLRVRIQTAGVTAAVQIVGHVPSGDPLNAEYRSADIYAFPSPSEGSARTLLEAASQSLPCVTTDVGSARDLFVDGESALIVPPDDPAAMSRAIARFIDEPQLRRCCIEKASEIARRHTCRNFIQNMVKCLAEAHERAQSAPRR